MRDHPDQATIDEVVEKFTCMRHGDQAEVERFVVALAAAPNGERKAALSSLDAIVRSSAIATDSFIAELRIISSKLERVPRAFSGSSWEDMVNKDV